MGSCLCLSEGCAGGDVVRPFGSSYRADSWPYLPGTACGGEGMRACCRESGVVLPTPGDPQGGHLKLHTEAVCWESTLLDLIRAGCVSQPSSSHFSKNHLQKDILTDIPNHSPGHQ